MVHRVASSARSPAASYSPFSQAALSLTLGESEIELLYTPSSGDLNYDRARNRGDKKLGDRFRMVMSPHSFQILTNSTTSASSPEATTPNGPSSNSSLRHPLSRPLSPDLPVRDALYLFANFSSYMRSPEEGGGGVIPSEDLRDTICLLDYARSLAAGGQNNVHVLHLKYRFQGVSGPVRKRYPYAYLTGDPILPTYNNWNGNPVPQPFSALNDHVLKIDYRENGIFEPLPSQAIFAHIATACQTPPRIIVISYVACRATQTHLAALSTWALTSPTRTFIFSPLETRLRETQPLHVALKHAIPMSMYAWPPSDTPPLLSRSPSPISVTLAKKRSFETSPLAREQPPNGQYRLASPSQRHYPPDPVATLTVLNNSTAPSRIASSPTADSVARIPLWALAPGVGVLHGSIPASIGVKLADFSAINLVRAQENGDTSTGQKGFTAESAGILTYPIRPTSLTNTSYAMARPVQSHARTACQAHNVPMPSGPSKIRTTHLTPPDRHSPPPRPPLGLAGDSFPTPSGSWPGQARRVPGWRRGRMERMEDTLEDLRIGKGANANHDTSADQVAGQAGNTDEGVEEHSAVEVSIHRLQLHPRVDLLESLGGRE